MLGIRLADFVTDPATGVDDVANAVHSSSFDLLDKVLAGLRTAGGADPGAPEFLRQYAAAAGIGLVVMAFVAVLAVVHGMRAGAGREDLHESLVKYLPLAVVLTLFSPAVGVLVSDLANAATNGIADWGAGSVAQVREKVEALRGISAEDLPGGTFVGLLVFAVLVVGALGLFVVVVAQDVGLAAAGIAAALAWGALVHPRWRSAAWRAPTVWLGLVLAKPVLFLVLIALFGVVGSAGGGTSGIGALTQLCLLAVSLFIACAVPLVLARQASTRPLTRSATATASATVIGDVRAVHATRRVIGPDAPTAASPVASPAGGQAIEKAYLRRQQDRGDVLPRVEHRRPRQETPMSQATGKGGYDTNIHTRR